jgi:Dimerisation domain
MLARRLPFWPLLQVLHRARRIGWWPEMKPLLRDRLFHASVAVSKEGNLSPPVLFQMATGYWASQAIYVAAKLGIADLLKDGPQSCVSLATATGSDAPSLFRLMRIGKRGCLFACRRRSLCSFPACEEPSDRCPWIT